MALIQEEKQNEEQGAQQKIFIIVAVVSVLLIGLSGFWFIRMGGGRGSSSYVINPSVKLEGANVIREGTPEFEKYKDKIIMDPPEAIEADRAIGDTVMTLYGEVRNFSGRAIEGLEVYGAVVNLDGKVVKERTVVAIPNQQDTLENNRNFKARVHFEGFRLEDDRANIKMRVTAFRFAPE